MQYVLDFDRVLFDTDAFIAKLEEQGIGDLPRDASLVQAITAKDIDWTAFVNPGVTDFLAVQGQDCVIVSSYISRHRLDNQSAKAELALFQSEKIKRSGVWSLVKRVYITDANKEPVLQELYRTDTPMVFLDDEREHIVTADRLGYQTVWLRTAKNRSLPTAIDQPESGVSVNSFYEFVELNKQWNQK